MEQKSYSFEHTHTMLKSNIKINYYKASQKRALKIMKFSPKLTQLAQSGRIWDKIIRPESSCLILKLQYPVFKRNHNLVLCICQI